MNSATFGELLELVHPSAESATLAGMLADTEAAIQISQELEPTDFHNERYGVIFEAVRSLLLGVEPIDKAGIVAECRRVVQERKLKIAVNESHLEFEGDPKRAISYAQTVKRMAYLRGAAGFAHWMIQELQTHPDPEQLYADVQERLIAIRPTQKSTSFVYGWDTLDMVKTIHHALANPKDEMGARFDWPWQSWNKMIRPLLAGMVGIVAAPDGQGKTTALEMVAEHWAMLGAHTVYVHLEDDLDYKKDRRMARFAQVPMETIEDRTYTKDELRRVAEAEENMGLWAGKLHYYHAPGKSMVDIIRELETRVSEGVCQAVVFDYLDKTQPTRAQAKIHGANTWERQADDMEQLKTFAERNRVPVMTATQGNKSMQNAGIQTRQSIQGAGQKSQKSQLVIILTRDLVGDEGLFDNQGHQIAEAGDYSPIVKVRVDKQNRGRTGQFQQIIAGRFFTIRDVEFHRVEVGG